MPESAQVTWDLKDLYSGIDDPRVEATLDEQLRRANEFRDRYRGAIDAADLSPGTLRDALAEYESILQETSKPMTYASLVFSTDTSDTRRGAFFQRIRERTSEISVRLIFFSLELIAVPEERIGALLEDHALAPYRHYIWAERLFREHRLSEPEEKILEEKANTGRRAFSRLFEQTVSNIPFRVARDGRDETLTLAEVISLLRESDREVRKAAAGSLTEGLVSNGPLLTYVHNTLIQDKATDDRMRGYACPEHSRHLENELDPGTVELVVAVAVEHYAIVARYYRLKREILGCEKLTHYDRQAPIVGASREVPFDEAREIIVRSFSEFSPTFGQIADRFFACSWIDAAVRKGKRGGAYCSYTTPDLHPYVFVNYLSRMDDVMTLGHELGHGVHACLARDQGYLNFHAVLPVAELASTFGEMLVFESLQEGSEPEDRLALYAQKIEDSFGTIFRQAAMYRFEQTVHNLRREKGELTTEEFSAVWQERLQEMFLDSLELGDEHRFWWMYVPHFISTPFYVYAYTFGELLVMALYAIYRREREVFVPKYIELLKAGGSMTPLDMLARVGIDIREPDFWRGGVSILCELVDRFEDLYRQSNLPAT